MADSRFRFKFSKKDHPQENSIPPRMGDEEEVKSFTGSLALRVFLISFVCLVLPLIAYCFLMYRYDFELKESQQARTLDLVSDTQVFIINQLVNFELETLEQITLYLNAYPHPTPDEEGQISRALATLAQREHVKEIFVLTKDGNNDALCTLSSKECAKEAAHNQIFFIQALKENDYTIFVEQQEKIIYFVKVLRRSPQREVLQTLNLAVSTSFLTESLRQVPGYQGVYKVSLFNEASMVIDGQEMALLQKKVNMQSEGLSKKEKEQTESIVLTRLPREPNTYEYEMGDTKIYATVVPLAAFKLNLLITCAQIKESYYLREFFYQTILLFVLIIVLGGLGALFLTYLMAKPLKRLCFVMHRVSQHDLTIRYQSCAYGFEINKVGAIFNRMIENLLYHLQQLQEKTIKQEILQQELYIGHQIQKSLVPTQIPEVPGIEIETALIPAKEVGGDFYDFFINPHNPDEMMILIADTSGHGVFGCFYSLTMRSILRSLGAILTSLKEVIIKANQLFYKDSGSSHVFVTTWIGSYNHKTHKITYSSCGHPLGFLFRKRQFLQELSTPGIALGAAEEIDPAMASMQLQPEDTLVFITDGLIEVRSPGGELYGKKRFITSVEHHSHLPAEELRDKILEDMEHFAVEPENQEDDVTLVIIKIR